jgi:hypothetical protein
MPGAYRPGEPVGRRLKFGGDTGFNVRYSRWIDP